MKKISLIVSLLALLNGGRALAAVSCPAKSAGQTLTIADIMACRSDIIDGKFYSGPGTGSKYVQVGNDGTDGYVSSNSGDIDIKAPIGESVDLMVNGVAVATVASTTLTALNLIVSGTTGITGAATFSSTLSVGGAITANGALTVAGASVFSSTISAGGAVTVNGATTHNAATTFNSTVSMGAALTSNAAATFNGDVSFTGEVGDYGTCTSSLTTSGGGTFTQGTGSCMYSKIGRLIHISGAHVWSSCTGSCTGNLDILSFGLSSAFNTSSTSGYNPACDVNLVGVAYTGPGLQAPLSSNSQNVNLAQVSTLGAASGIPVNSTGSLYFSCTYIGAAQ